MNTQFEELIARHLDGKLNKEEKELLARMLKVPENQLYLASAIDRQFLNENLEIEADNETGAFMFQEIQERIQQHKQAALPIEDELPGAQVVSISWYKRSLVRWMAAAAAVLLIVSFIVYSNYNKSEQPIVIQSNNNVDSTLSLVHHEVNNTGKDKRILLADGSLIILADKSELTYREPFTDKREIILSGKAHFKVAKDKTRPFIVISSDISTTALGTEFTVTAFARENQISVRLYEGKVVVRAVEKGNWRMKDDVFLLPGQELIYSDQSLAYVRSFNKKQAAPKEDLSEGQNHDDPFIPENSKGSWYMFNNQSLGQVLEALSAIYNVKIVYNKKDVQNIYWTGQYNRADSLESILNRIGTVHNLTVTKKDTAFMIAK